MPVSNESLVWRDYFLVRQARKDLRSMRKWDIPFMRHLIWR